MSYISATAHLRTGDRIQGLLTVFGLRIESDTDDLHLFFPVNDHDAIALADEIIRVLIDQRQEALRRLAEKVPG